MRRSCEYAVLRSDSTVWIIVLPELRGGRSCSGMRGGPYGTIGSTLAKMKWREILREGMVLENPCRLPGWSSGWESACQHWGHRSRKIPHATGHLSPCATTTEAHLPRAHSLQQEKPPQWEACSSQPESSRHSPQLEKGHAQTAEPKINIFKNACD